MLPFPTAPERRRRLPRLFAGLVVFGIGIALMVHSDLGLGPWDVLHQGIANRTGVPIGMVNILVGVVALAGWIPMRDRVGIGTLANAIVIGVVIDLTLLVAPDVDQLALRTGLLGIGVVAVAVGSGAYIGAGLGPGPRDGLMTGLARTTGASVRAVRTGIELAVLLAGLLLGGTVGVGTVVFALGIGPLVQVALNRLALPPLGRPEPVAQTPAGGHPTDHIAR